MGDQARGEAARRPTGGAQQQRLDRDPGLEGPQDDRQTGQLPRGDGIDDGPAETLGAATFFALLITGQMLASVLFDQFGLLGLAQRSIDLPRLVGIALLVGGVVLIRR